MNTKPWTNPKFYQEEQDMCDREFWKGYNRRKHAYFMSAKDEQREAFREECAKPEPAKKPLTKVLEIRR